MMHDTGRPVINYTRGGSGEPLLLINGWTASGSVWPADWIRQLEERFLVIRPDNRGSGWSRTAARPFSIADLADDAKTVMEACGVERARVLGLSMGGMIAQELTLRHPDAVERLVLVGTRPPTPAAVLSAPHLLVDSMRRPGRDESLWEYFRVMWAAFAGPDFAKSHAERLDELVEQIVRRPTPRQGMFDQVRAMMAWRGAQRLTGIAVPTDVIHGDSDPLIPVANGRRLAALIPGAQYQELVGVGHLVPQEAGEFLLETLAREPARPISVLRPRGR